MPIWWR